MLRSENWVGLAWQPTNTHPLPSPAQRVPSTDVVATIDWGAIVKLENLWRAGESSSSGRLLVTVDLVIGEFALTQLGTFAVSGFEYSWKIDMLV